MTDHRAKDIDPEVLAVFLEEVAEFLAELKGESSLLRVRERIEALRSSSELVGANAIASMASSTLMAIANATSIDRGVAKAVREFTEEVDAEAREVASLVGVQINEAPVELRAGTVEEPWWKVW